MLKTDEVRPVRPNLTQSMSVLSNDRQSFKFVLFFLPVFILHLAGSYVLLLSFFRLHLRLCVCPSRGEYSFLMFFNKGSLEAKRVT